MIAETITNYHMPEDTFRINLCGAPVTPALMAQISVQLEMGHPVFIENAAIPMNGPGICAFKLGIAVEKQNQEAANVSA